jgi:hypothetical protein
MPDLQDVILYRSLRGIDTVNQALPTGYCHRTADKTLKVALLRVGRRVAKNHRNGCGREDWLQVKGSWEALRRGVVISGTFAVWCRLRK